MDHAGISGFSGLIYLAAQYRRSRLLILYDSDDVGGTQSEQWAVSCKATGNFIPNDGFGVRRHCATRSWEGDGGDPAGIPRTPIIGRRADQDMASPWRSAVTLTPQQLIRVLMMLSEVMLNKQIAYELGV